MLALQLWGILRIPYNNLSSNREEELEVPGQQIIDLSVRSVDNVYILGWKVNEDGFEACYRAALISAGSENEG
jgi:hypothetical protein